MSKGLCIVNPRLETNKCYSNAYLIYEFGYFEQLMHRSTYNHLCITYSLFCFIVKNIYPH